MTEQDYCALVDAATKEVHSWWYASEFNDIAHPVPYWSELTMGERSSNRLRRLPAEGLPKPNLSLVGLDAQERPRIVRTSNSLGEPQSEDILDYSDDTIKRIRFAWEGPLDARAPIEINRGHAEVVSDRVRTYEVTYPDGGRERFELEWADDHVIGVNADRTEEDGATTSTRYTFSYADSGALTAIVDAAGTYAFALPRRFSGEELEGLAIALAQQLQTAIESIAPDGPVCAVILEYGDLAALPPVWIALATPAEREAILREYDGAEAILEAWAAESYGARVDGTELPPLPDDYQAILEAVRRETQIKQDGSRERKILFRAREILAETPWKQLKPSPDFVVVALLYGDDPDHDIRASLGKARYKELKKKGHV